MLRAFGSCFRRLSYINGSSDFAGRTTSSGLTGKDHLRNDRDGPERRHERIIFLDRVDQSANRDSIDRKFLREARELGAAAGSRFDWIARLKKLHSIPSE
jgi:hypothetical protein